MRQLIINADDFGFTPSVTRGILEAHAAGVVTSASVMVGLPGWSDAAARLRDVTIDVGLHLNLLVGRPLTRAPTLTGKDGAFVPLGRLIARAVTFRLDPADVAAECAAQLDMLRAAGARVSHIDSHRHTHALPGVWRPVTEAGVRWVRAPNFALLRLSAPWRRGRSPGHFAGLGLVGGHGLVDALDRLRPGVTELMVHPGYSEPALAALDPYTVQRERELAVLSSPQFRERLARGDIALTRFDALDAGIFQA